MAGPAVFALIDRIHLEIRLLLALALFHFEQAFVTFAASDAEHLSMFAVIENNSFDWLLKDNGLRRLHVAAMTSGAVVLLGSKSGVAVVTSTTVFALIKGGHSEIARRLGRTASLLK